MPQHIVLERHPHPGRTKERKLNTPTPCAELFPIGADQVLLLVLLLLLLLVLLLVLCCCCCSCWY